MNCRGYAVAQFMQPEPAKYSYGPNVEAKTFFQPEHHYFSHHPGRFFYLRDDETGEFFSAPYEPVRVPLDSFSFTLLPSQIVWCVEKLGIEIKFSLIDGRANGEFDGSYVKIIADTRPTADTVQ